MDKLNSRREFLKMAAALAGGTLVMENGISVFAEENANPIKRIWRLNPAFRMKKLSTTEIELYTHLKTGELLVHQFSGLEADILRAIVEEEKLEELIPDFARVQNMSRNDCERHMNASLDDFADAHLIYSGDTMMVKKVEFIHE